jgi:hypothetical protein
MFHQVFAKLSTRLKCAQWQATLPSPTAKAPLPSLPHNRTQSIVRAVSAFIAGTPDVQGAAGEILCDILSFGDDQQQQ